jgi:predicted methyltransferase
MEHIDHVNLLRDGVPTGGVWADLGSGGGAFTLALADLLRPDGVIYSVDRDGRALRRQADAMRAAFPRTAVQYLQSDYTRPLERSASFPAGLPPLDGVVMANALHFQRQRERAVVLRLVHGYLKPGGRLIVVEYNTDRGNLWVPHPFSYATWERLAGAAGFDAVRLLARRPSRFLGEIYSALACRARDRAVE